MLFAPLDAHAGKRRCVSARLAPAGRARCFMEAAVFVEGAEGHMDLCTTEPDRLSLAIVVTTTEIIGGVKRVDVDCQHFWISYN